MAKIDYEGQGKFVIDSVSIDSYSEYNLLTQEHDIVMHLSI